MPGCYGRTGYYAAGDVLNPSRELCRIGLCPSDAHHKQDWQETLEASSQTHEPILLLGVVTDFERNIVPRGKSGNQEWACRVLPGPATGSFHLSERSDPQ